MRAASPSSASQVRRTSSSRSQATRRVGGKAGRLGDVVRPGAARVRLPLGELDSRRYEATAPVGPPGPSRSASTFNSHPDRSPWGVRQSVQEHQVPPGSARLPLDLANNPLTNDLEASPEISELASDLLLRGSGGRI